MEWHTRRLKGHISVSMGFIPAVLVRVWANAKATLERDRSLHGGLLYHFKLMPPAIQHIRTQTNSLLVRGVLRRTGGHKHRWCTTSFR
jgi:hypothetical protein